MQLNFVRVIQYYSVRCTMSKTSKNLIAIFTEPRAMALHIRHGKELWNKSRVLYPGSHVWNLLPNILSNTNVFEPPGYLTYRYEIPPFKLSIR